MESARVRYLRTSFLIQRVREYRTKHFPCYNLFISYLLRFFNSNQIFILHQAEQISSYVFIPSESKHAASSNPSVNIFRNVYLASPAFHLFPLPCFFYFVCFELSDISLLGKTRCRRNSPLTAYLPSLKLFLPLHSVENFAKQANLASHRVYFQSLFALLFLDVLFNGCI